MTSVPDEPAPHVIATPQELERGTKTCPQCAEDVKAAALVCRFCGYRFDAPLAATGTVSPGQAPALPAGGEAVAATPVVAPRSQMTAASAIMLVGAVVIAVGSIGPWATSPFASASGTSGDGVFTLIAGVVLFFLALVRNRHFVLGSLAILVAGGVGVYDLIHIHNSLRSVTFAGVQVDHVGWGLYVVVVGAVIALAGLLKQEPANKPA